MQLALGAETLLRQPLCIDEAVEPPGDTEAPAEDAEEDWSEDEEGDAQSEASCDADAAENGELADGVVVLPLQESFGEAPADDAEDLRPMWAGD